MLAANYVGPDGLRQRTMLGSYAVQAISASGGDAQDENPWVIDYYTYDLQGNAVERLRSSLAIQNYDPVTGNSWAPYLLDYRLYDAWGNLIQDIDSTYGCGEPVGEYGVNTNPNPSGYNDFAASEEYQTEGDVAGFGAQYGYQAEIGASRSASAAAKRLRGWPDGSQVRRRRSGSASRVMRTRMGMRSGGGRRFRFRESFELGLDLDRVPAHRIRRCSTEHRDVSPRSAVSFLLPAAVLHVRPERVYRTTVVLDDLGEDLRPGLNVGKRPSSCYNRLEAALRSCMERRRCRCPHKNCSSSAA